jgi:hypothetical protein
MDRGRMQPDIRINQTLELVQWGSQMFWISENKFNYSLHLELTEVDFVLCK